MLTSTEPATVTVADEVPIAQPFTNGREVELVEEVLRTGQLGAGAMVARFERMFAEFVGVRHAVALSSGTSALRIAAAAARWRAGDVVLTSPFSSVASANVARVTDATIAYADVDPGTLTLDAETIEAAITPATRGIVPVDSFGWPVDVDAIADVARRHGLTVIEDACDALGARYRGRSVGANGVPAVFAFNADRQMTTGEGGMLVTDDDDLAARWRAHDHRGYDCRMSDLAAGVGIAQLEKLPRVLALRQMVAREYERLLADVPGLATPSAGSGELVRSWFRYRVMLDDGIDRDAVIERLAERGIQTKPYERDGGPIAGLLANARAVAGRLLAIPFFPQMSPQQQERVAAELRDVLAAG